MTRRFNFIPAPYTVLPLSAACCSPKNKEEENDSLDTDGAVGRGRHDLGPVPHPQRKKLNLAIFGGPFRNQAAAMRLFFGYDGHAVSQWCKSTRGVVADELQSDSQELCASSSANSYPRLDG
jgi:hypothetical protein